ncbi:telomere length regulation protein [Scheffersomyces spartinae]|uniref:Small ribosomal subunit protein mS41 n=1 Tax=Scheffersomyces spartinae TaxID=45513 RepID=A0A9P7VAH9_9ASCO|nr:telomere length regulation protein [Scheffersomyces spartinae]KAG7194031.1 telomere length regulation protein [Scheffersomyces spartinae]
MRTNKSTLNKSNVTDLETFFKAIGRKTVEHVEAFEGDLNKFLELDGPKLKEMGIDCAQRKYMLKWKHKYVNDLENLREHKQGTKKHGGERKQKEVRAKKRALERLEERKKFQELELEAEQKGERDF